MLSAQKQILLMSVYPNSFTKKSAEGVYGNPISLERSIQYLCNASYLKSERNKDHTATYYFTPEGVMITELLFRLPDAPEKYKGKARLTKFEVE